MKQRKFYPFEEVYDEDEKGIDDLLELLDLGKARLALLWQLLRRFEIDVWFEDEDDNPCLTVNTFWDMNHVASMPLIELLEHVVAHEHDIQVRTDQAQEPDRASYRVPPTTAAERRRGRQMIRWRHVTQWVRS